MDARKHADPVHGENTSDHTYQSISVDLKDSNDNTTLSGLRGATLNMMNQCRSREKNLELFGNDYSNNPWNMHESLKDYLDRKERQLEQIINTIRAGYDGQNAPFDFMFLQEIDILTGPGKVPPKVAARHQALKDKFYRELKNLGWEVLLSAPGSNEMRQRAIAILYNARSLTIKPESAKGELPVNKGSINTFSGYSCEFEHNESKTPVKLVGLHLEYGEDYSQSIPALQRQICAENKVGVMGGDTNHPANQKITGMICTWSNATNLGAIMPQDQSEAKLTVKHEDTEIIKCYDAFFVNPTKDTRAEIVEGSGERFASYGSEYYVVRQDPNPHKHLSAPGEPWRRGGWSEYQRRLQGDNVSPLAAKPATSAANPRVVKPSAAEPATAGIEKGNAKFSSSAVVPQQLFTPTANVQHPSARLSKQDFLKQNLDEKGDATKQAARIVAELKADLKKNPNKKICLLYAANNGQAENLHQHNQKNNGDKIPEDIINGSGQALLLEKSFC